MEWAWMMYLQTYGTPRPGKAGLCIITTCLWLDKGNSKTKHKIADWIGVPINDSSFPRISGHKWSKPEKCIATWTKAFVGNGAVVLDPFAGGGIVPVVCKKAGISWVAFEIDPNTAEIARGHVANVRNGTYIVPGTIPLF